MEVKINEIVNKLSQDYQDYGATIHFEKNETLKKYRENFIEKFSLLALERMSPQESLDELMNMNNQESMVYWLELKRSGVRDPLSPSYKRLKERHLWCSFFVFM